MALVQRLTRAGIRGASEGLFPANDQGLPDFEDAELVQRTEEYIAELPPPQRRLLVLLFVTVELIAPVLLLVPRRFSRLAPERRAAAVRGWRCSRFFLLRVLGDALKATTTMMYMSHPRVVEHIQAYKTCERPGDALPFEVRPQALAGARDDSRVG